LREGIFGLFSQKHTNEQLQKKGGEELLSVRIPK